MKTTRVILLIIITLSVFLNLFQFSYYFYSKKSIEMNARWMDHTYQVISKISKAKYDFLKLTTNKKVDMIDFNENIETIQDWVSDSPEQSKRIKKIRNLMKSDSTDFSTIETIFDSLLEFEEDLYELRKKEMFK